MNWENYLYPQDEKPLDRLVEGYSNTSIFRTIAFVGDSMSSGEFETCDENGEHGFYDLFEYSFGQHIARKNGLTAHSFSRGGMTAREYINGYAEEKGFWDPQKAAQAYVIALGYNDLVCAKMDVGSTDDIDRRALQGDRSRRKVFLYDLSEDRRSKARFGRRKARRTALQPCRILRKLLRHRYVP